jgi:dTDP-4-dehydrorhamnose 3,5-epimerase
MTEKIFGVVGGPISGVAVKKLNTIPDGRGFILHMLRNDDPLFTQFGEIYFSAAYPGVIKGWHIHTRMTLNYAVVQGMVKLVLYDDRANSPTRGALMEIYLGERNHLLVQIPPHVWNGFTTIGPETAIVANCSSIPHDPTDIKRLDPFSPTIPYDWSTKHG